MKNLLRLLLCVGLGGFGVLKAITPKDQHAENSKTTAAKADAKTLVTDARKALATMIKAARLDTGLDPKIARNKPFWKSTQLIAKNLVMAEKGLAARSNDFFKGITDARQAEVQLKVDWELTDSKNKQVIDNGKVLGHALAQLRTGFSKEAGRKKKGGELTAQEKAQFEKIKNQQKDLLAGLQKLEKEAQKDPALEHGLRKMQAQAQHILKEPGTLDAFIATLYLLDEQIGLVRGYEYYVDESWRADYGGLVRWASACETTYSQWETSVSYSWTSIDLTVDIHDAEAINVADTISDGDIDTEQSYAENGSFDMSEADANEVAQAEDNDADVDSDDTADDDSMDDGSDEQGEDMTDDGGGDDEAADQPDDSGDDGGGDEGD